MLNYIIKIWRKKRVIVFFIIMGFFIGSLFLSIGTSLSYENYISITDNNSGTPEKQLALTFEFDKTITSKGFIEIINEITSFGEIQFLSLSDVQVLKAKWQVVPVSIGQEKGDWHIPIITGRYFNDSDCLNSSKEVIIGKDIAFDNDFKIGDRIKVNNVQCKVIGITGRRDRSTKWDQIIYMPLTDFFSENQEYFFNGLDSKTKLFAVLKNGKNKFIQNYSKIESICENKGATIYFEELIDSIDKSSFTNSVILTILSSGLIFLIVIINIVNLMQYWVMERKSQIGIMKIVGATNQYLMKWMYIEVWLMALIGTVLALVVQMLIATFLTKYLVQNGIYINVNWINCVISIVVTILCGLISSLVPVKFLLGLNPVDVITYE